MLKINQSTMMNVCNIKKRMTTQINYTKTKLRINVLKTKIKY